MKYNILSCEKNDQYMLWGCFEYPAEKPERVLSFLNYLKSSINLDGFIVVEVETGKAYKLLDVFNIMYRKLSSQNEE